MIYQCQIPLGGLPINLLLVGNKDEGKVVFVKIAPVSCIYENASKDEVSAMFQDTCFQFKTGDSVFDNSNVFNYNTMYDYKEIPLMLRWLQQQNLQQPE